MKLSFPGQTFSILETPLSDYIKKTSPLLDKIIHSRMETIFGEKLPFDTDKSFHKDSIFFHIMLNGDIIGYFICMPQYKHVVWIDEFFIEESYRDKGYGTQALIQLKMILKTKKYNKVALTFVEGNPAERLYLKNGFTTKIGTDVMCKI